MKAYAKNVIGVAMIVAGIALGLYAGIWWAFVGGIMDVITEVRAVKASVSNVALGVAKVMFAGAIGSFSALWLCIPGMSLISASQYGK
jgi:hypothetical protein